ncbi:D-alanine--D-alanine ligase [bacterium]|nr:D-alanine--D-alanine ligase [candidate division CSSED10-310 bacterium]
MKPKVIGVLFGGRSGEHEVSMKSAQSVMQTLQASDRYDVFPMGITRNGDWICGPEAMERLIECADASLLQGAASFDRTRVRFGSGPTVLSSRLPAVGVLERLDVAFPVLHGPFGEDGTVQGMFQLARIPYVGCGVTASAVGMDKEIFKRVMRAHGIPVVPDVCFRRSEWMNGRDAIIARIEASLSYPVFCKPVNMGSSVGISKCRNREELVKGIDCAVRFDRRLIVEWAVPQAREIEVSVLGNDCPDASVPGEIIPKREFYDYTAKYLDSGAEATELLVPARLDETEARTIREAAAHAFRAVDGAGMARVDFLINRSSGEIYLNEINTIPGFTAISMYAKLWAATGIPYMRLLDKLIELAIERFEDQNRNQISYT